MASRLEPQAAGIKFPRKWGDSEVGCESGHGVDPDTVSVGAAAHAGAAGVRSAPAGISSMLGISLWQRRMQLSLSFLWGKNHYLNPVLQLLPQEKQQQAQPQLRKDCPTGRSKKSLCFDAHGSTNRCCWLSGARGCPTGGFCVTAHSSPSAGHC